MSVPRPAMFVATVTAPTRPASAMIAASSASRVAFRMRQPIPRAASSSPRRSDDSTLRMPTSTGRPRSWCSCTRSATASNLLASVVNGRSARRRRITGRCVGTRTTGSR